jgi:hypothetical protein
MHFYLLHPVYNNAGLKKNELCVPLSTYCLIVKTVELRIGEL